MRFLIIGSGFSGSVLARELVSQLDCQVEIWEERNHLAGNCYTSEDGETGIMVHHYGPHIFNTDNKEIWNYFNRFATLRPYVHRVKAIHKGQVFSFPINLMTLNQFFKGTFSPDFSKKYFDQMKSRYEGEPGNFEEQAIKFVGEDLYHAFFYGYTKKQWGCEPSELPASIMKRIPVRFDYNDNYHLHQYTGIPENGYTEFVQNLLQHPRIHVELNKKFDTTSTPQGYDHIFFTGSLDAYFNYCYGRLSYRTLIFEKQILTGDFQGCTQINYCDEDVPYTRVTEHKHFTPWKKSDKSVVFTEYSKEAESDDDLFYPKRLEEDLVRLKKYRQKAEMQNHVSFLGRLGTYRYLDMQHVIAEAIEYAKLFSESIKSGHPIHPFPNVQ